MAVSILNTLKHFYFHQQTHNVVNRNVWFDWWGLFRLSIFVIVVLFLFFYHKVVMSRIILIGRLVEFLKVIYI